MHADPVHFGDRRQVRSEIGDDGDRMSAVAESAREWRVCTSTPPRVGQ
jgi:hypothetical protein